MTKVYVPPRSVIFSNCHLEVGEKGTLESLTIALDSRTKTKPYGEYEGQIKMGGLFYDVYIEEETGKLWFDSEEGR